MNEIKIEAFRLVDMLLQHPQTDTARTISGIIAVVVLAWTFLKIGDRMDLPNVGIVSAFFYTALGGAILIIGMAAGHVYLPELQKQFGDIAFFTAIAVVLSIAVVSPIVNTLINGKYLGTMMSWFIAAATCVVAITIVINIFAFVDRGGRALQRGAEHNEATKAVIGK